METKQEMEHVIGWLLDNNDIQRHAREVILSNMCCKSKLMRYELLEIFEKALQDSVFLEEMAECLQKEILNDDGVVKDVWEELCRTTR